MTTSAKSSNAQLRNKQSEIIREVTQLARRLGPGIKLPTMHELSKSLGVTITTLDRSLGKLESQGVIVRRAGSGIYVSDRLLEVRIGLIFGHDIFQTNSSPLFALLLKHCEKRAAAGHERFSVYLDTPGLTGSYRGETIHHDLQEVLEQGKLDGLLLLMKRNDEQERLLRKYDVPMVALTDSPQGPGSVTIDARQYIDLGVKTLCDRGCHSLGLLGILPTHRAMFCDAAERHGAQIADQWIVCPEPQHYPKYNTHESLGRDFAADMISRCGRDGLPDGLVITDDILARGACAGLDSLGVSPGNNLMIASHANKDSDALADWEDKLILIEVDIQEIVEAMFSILERLMANDTSVRVSARIATKDRAVDAGIKTPKTLVSA